MKSRSAKGRFLLTAYALVFGSLALGVCDAPVEARSSAVLDESLKLYLQNYLTMTARRSDPQTHVSVAEVRLQDGKTEEVVYVTGGGWCGATGRCTILFLEKKGDTYEVLGKTPAILSPIYLLSSQSNGHPDIAVSVGGGLTLPVDAVSVLTFNSSSYPASAYNPPAVIRTSPPRGSKEIIAVTSPSEPLY